MLWQQLRTISPLSLLRIEVYAFKEEISGDGTESAKQNKNTQIGQAEPLGFSLFTRILKINWEN